MLRRASFALVVLLTVVVGAAGCPKKPAAAAGPDAGTPKLPTAEGQMMPGDVKFGSAGGGLSHGAHGAPAPSRSTIFALPMTAPIVTVNDTTFTHADLERTINQAAALAGFPPDQIDPQVRDAFESPAYEKLIERELLREEAKKRGLWPSDDDLKKERDRLVGTLPPGKTLDDALKMMGVDKENFEKDLAIDLAIAKLFTAMKEEIEAPDDAALKKVYDENESKFVVKDTASASHILIRVAENAPKEEIAKAMARIKAIRSEVAGKDGAFFKKVATEKSEDPSAKANGGDLGTFARGDMLQEFEDAAFKLKKDEISQVVRSSRGFHVIRGQGTTPGKKKTFDEVKPLITDHEVTRAFMEKVDAVIGELRTAAKITRTQEPIPSPIADKDDKGSKVPAWRPSGTNVRPGAANPHAGMVPGGITPPQ